MTKSASHLRRRPRQHAEPFEQVRQRSGWNAAAAEQTSKKWDERADTNQQQSRAYKLVENENGHYSGIFPEGDHFNELQLGHCIKR